MSAHLDQVGIALTGVTAIFLTQSVLASRRRWAPVFGMIGQPFWFYAAVTAEQWGIVFVCALYTVAWSKGVWTHWIVPYLLERSGVPPFHKWPSARQAAFRSWLNRP